MNFYLEDNRQGIFLLGLKTEIKDMQKEITMDKEKRNFFPLSSFESLVDALHDVTSSPKS